MEYGYLYIKFSLWLTQPFNHWIKLIVRSHCLPIKSIDTVWFLEGLRSPGQAPAPARAPAPRQWKWYMWLAVWSGIGRGGRVLPVWTINLHPAQWREIMQSSESHFKLLLWVGRYAWATPWHKDKWPASVRVWGEDWRSKGGSSYGFCRSP